MCHLPTRLLTTLLSSIVGVERILEYTDLNTEADWVVESKAPAQDWPKGEIEFVNYATRYREGLELVLKGISAKIRAGEKVRSTLRAELMTKVGYFRLELLEEPEQESLRSLWLCSDWLNQPVAPLWLTGLILANLDFINFDNDWPSFLKTLFCSPELFEQILTRLTILPTRSSGLAWNWLISNPLSRRSTRAWITQSAKVVATSALDSGSWSV